MKMRISSKWKRREVTTRCADPTVIVEWSNGIYSIQEFQNIYRVFTCMSGHDCFDKRKEGEILHQRLERRWHRRRNAVA
jgi:hypothetical protein